MLLVRSQRGLTIICWLFPFAGPEGEFYSFHDKCFELKVQKYVMKRVESICFMKPLGVVLVKLIFFYEIFCEYPCSTRNLVLVSTVLSEVKEPMYVWAVE